MPSIRKIAERAGVSIATVSRALNNDLGISAKTRDRVLAVANSAGYKAKVGRRVTNSVGFAYTGEQTLSHPFEAAVLEGAVKSLGGGGFNLVLLNVKRDRLRGETYTQFFRRAGVRGVILRIVAESRDICRTIASEGFPHVVLSERFESSDINCVDCDSKPDSVRAMEYLIALGHRQIAFATHNIPDRDHTDRLEGYREALGNHGLPFRPELVFKHPATLAGGATVLKMVMSMAERPTAIYYVDWLLAVGGIKAAHEMGVRVPEDISIVGFDDTNMRHAVHPTLTAVCQNAVKLGAEAGTRLTQVLTGERKAPFQITMPSFFEINESTGPPPEEPIRIATNGRRTAEVDQVGSDIPRPSVVRGSEAS
jgi:DNA-binding LacI/PurR family transcriptional regulator